MFGRKTKYPRMSGHRILVASILCLFGFCLLAQRPVQKTQKKASESSAVQKKDTAASARKSGKKEEPKQKSKVYLLHSDVLRKTLDRSDVQVVVGNVVFRHDSLYMYCDSAYYFDQINSFEAFGNVRMEQGDTLFVYGDHLYYDGMTQIAQMRMNVRMENRTTTLLTDSLNYDRVYSLGYFFDGGTLMDEQNVLTSEWGEYNPQTKQSVFNYNVKLVNPQFTLTSDTLRYNTATKVANIVGPSDILSDNNHIYSESGYYNTQTGKADLYQRSVLTNEGKQLTGDTLFYDRNEGVGEAFHNMVMTDTINKNMMTGDYGYYNEKTKYAFATRKAVAIDYSQGDSLFLHADTLMMKTFQLDTDSMYREMRAFHKARFYRTDVQGVSDSLVFSTKDSCLTLYDNPIVWNKNQQLLGEKILVYMNDSTIDWAHIINQALSVEMVDSTKYNQVTGKEMKAFFTDGEMKKVEVIGSVRLVYYPMDSDSTLIGMNVSETSKLEIYLEKQKLDHMVMSPQSNGTLYPLPQIPKGKDKLDNFVWFDYIRPLNKDDIFEWRAKKAGDELKKNIRGPIELPNQHLFEPQKKEE
ncbi:OstA-like protein [uncultured Phocaeicola sp.]|uniref:OstA-like protein n=1 Tax=uncultured Phocaeicola sp. TaxID=990718 RepID=UPI0025E073DD|nr:OstA-like protein [uncultured Phocaeicola sp.]